MHRAVITFRELVKRIYPEYFSGKNIIDFGSLDINGTNKNLFENCHYIGVDIVGGPNVDIVCKCHEFGQQDLSEVVNDLEPSCAGLSFDVVISTEMLEHDYYWEKSLIAMYDMLKKDGLLMFTCATAGRIQHDPYEGKHKLPEKFPDHYKNLIEKDIRSVLKTGKMFKNYKFVINQNDLYFYGIKK